MTGGRPTWALYDAPCPDAVVADLQGLRQAAPVTAAVAQSRYALMHVPSLVRVADVGERAELLVETLRQVVTSARLSTEQQVIARWMFFPPDEAAQLLLHERRTLAGQEIIELVRDRAGKPVTRTKKQIEDRETRVLAMIADLLLDDCVAAALERPTDVPPVQAPVDPYEGKGYVWLDSEHQLRFDETDPRLQTLRYSIVVQAVRRDQRVFSMRHDPILDGEEGPIEVLSVDEGHRLLGRADDSRPNQAKAHLLFFYLGRTLNVGETTRLVFERTFSQDAAPQPWFGMEMDGTPQERLLLEVYLPGVLGLAQWAREEWSGGNATATLLQRDEVPITSLGEGTWARYEITRPRSWHHYRLVW